MYHHRPRHRIRRALWYPRVGTVLLLLTWAVILGLPTGAAHADYYPYKSTYWRWQGRIICIEDHSGVHWPVYRATWRWDATPELRIVPKQDCTGYRQVVKVQSGWYGRNGYAGWPIMYGSNGWITSGTVYLNRSYSQDERGEAHVTSREIGHALGLAATDDRRAIMYAGPNDPWYRWCQPADLVELDGLYP